LLVMSLPLFSSTRPDRCGAWEPVASAEHSRPPCLRQPAAFGALAGPIFVPYVFRPRKAQAAPHNTGHWTDDANCPSQQFVDCFLSVVHMPPRRKYFSDRDEFVEEPGHWLATGLMDHFRDEQGHAHPVYGIQLNSSTDMGHFAPRGGPKHG